MRIFTSLRIGSAAATRHLLVLRFVLVNLVCLALLAVASLQGWVMQAVSGDATRLVLVIAAYHVYGLSRCAWEVCRTSHQLDDARRGEAVTALARLSSDDRRLALGKRMRPIYRVADNLVFLGLVGTVVGFVIALSGVTPDATADVAAIGPMIGTLVTGMGVALYTTLAGAVLYLWLSSCASILEAGAVDLVLEMERSP